MLNTMVNLPKLEKVEADKIYEQSYVNANGTHITMFKKNKEKYLYVQGKGKIFEDFVGDVIDGDTKVCQTNHHNRLILNKYFAWTKPKAFGNKVTTVGLGDRLGLASPGHIKSIRHKKAKPILAQQSIRELTLMNQSMDDVIDAASYAVFQEGYTLGFGADGDHLKEEDDIRDSIKSGITMLTLDCSDFIDNTISSYSSEELEREYNKLSSQEREMYEEKYLKKTFTTKDSKITLSKEKLMYNVLLYREAVQFTIHVFNEHILTADHIIDFELSIDETEAITEPGSHFFVAKELVDAGVIITSLAPRFIGEFQKGIDYSGDIDKFKEDFIKHSYIAKHFNYKLSIHSGSDKFSIYPVIADYTDGLFHLKTAGTSWLEAMYVIADKNPSLYRKMHAYAFENFEEAKKNYHITPELSGIKPLNEETDENLVEFLSDPNARQVLHVSFGNLLSAVENNEHLFREEFFDTLIEFETSYDETLIQHIDNHLETLKIPQAL